MERGRDASLRPTVLRAVVLGVIASAIGIVLGLSIHWFPVQGSTQAHRIDGFWDVLIICSVPIFVLVASVVLFSVFKFRARPGEEELDGPPIHGNTQLEIIWTSLPALMLVALCAYAYVVLRDIEKAPAKAAGPEMHVKVIGQQFTWTFEYTGTNGKPFTSTQLYLPKDKSVKFDVVSKDVLHDFWVPAFRMKIDAVPGIATHYRVTPDRLGDYPVVCAELCGLGHAFMRQTAHVYTEAAFATWRSKQSQGAAPAVGASPSTGAGGSTGAASGGGTGSSGQGKMLFSSGNGTSTPCASCHTLADAGATATIGPDLDKYLKTKNATFIRTSILQPNAKVEKGFPKDVMPGDYSKTLSKPELDALVSYLSTVTKKG